MFATADLLADGLYVMLFLFNWFHLVTMIYFVMIMERDKGLSTIAAAAASPHFLYILGSISLFLLLLYYVGVIYECVLSAIVLDTYEYTLS